MAHIEGEIVIERPVEEVFDVVSDERNEPRYNPRLLWVEKVSSGPIRRGTQFRAATKTMGRPAEMTIEFKRPPRPLWIPEHSHLPHNSMRIEVKPDSFDAMTLLRKIPGEGMMPEAITVAPPPGMRADGGPEPYELLIEEAMIGDPTLFAREDTVLESWRIVERILTDYAPVERYAQGSWGPAGASALTRRSGGWPEEPPGGPV